MRIAVAVLLLLHGVAHLVGFAASWRLLDEDEVPYTTRLLGGSVDVGDVGIRIVGLLWLVTAIAFAAASVGLWAEASWWRPVTLAVIVFSLAMSIGGLPAAKVGVVINLVLLAAYGVASSAGWIRTW